MANGNGPSLLVLLLACMLYGEAFIANLSARNHAAPHTLVALKAKTNSETVFASRRDLFGHILFSTTASTVIAPIILGNKPALADVTNKVASSSSLRLLKRALRSLEDLELAASSNDYEGIKTGLRTPPFTEVRKNCVVLIRGGEDGPDAEALQSTYADFIKSVEELDSNAGLGVRGRKGISLIGPYDESVKRLRAFLEVAERSVAIPIAQPTPNV